jgi:hypothetical protein
MLGGRLRAAQCLYTRAEPLKFCPPVDFEAEQGVGAVRPQMATLAPKAAKFFATPRLMPLPPPVTKTVLPLNFRSCSPLHSETFIPTLIYSRLARALVHPSPDHESW